MSKYDNYEDITNYEYLMILRYQYTFDKNDLAKLLRNYKLPITKGMTSFLADVIDGEIDRPKGKKQSKIHQDIRIWLLVKLLIEEGYPLRTSKTKEGASELAVKILKDNQDMDRRKIPLANRGNLTKPIFLSPDGVISAYNRGKKFDDQHNEGVIDHSTLDRVINNFLGQIKNSEG
ncbi:MAG: hypothetical protein WC782_01285 [Methylococcaceae bacterium]|jgi:hypothetical protein